MGSQACGPQTGLEQHMDRKPWIRVLIALVFLGIAAGVGWRLYDAGYSHGVTDTLTTAAAANGTTSTVIIRDAGGPDHGFFPFFVIFPIGFVVLFFVVRPLIWGSGMGRRGFGPGGPRHGLEDWHKRQHEAETTKTE